MCDCIKEVNKLLEEKGDNTQLDLSYFLDGRVRIKISVIKRDNNNRKKPTNIVPAYCPFCGKDYDKTSKDDK